MFSSSSFSTGVSSLPSLSTIVLIQSSFTGESMGEVRNILDRLACTSDFNLGTEHPSGSFSTGGRCLYVAVLYLDLTSNLQHPLWRCDVDKKLQLTHFFLAKFSTALFHGTSLRNDAVTVYIANRLSGLVRLRFFGLGFPPYLDRLMRDCSDFRAPSVVNFWKLSSIFCMVSSALILKVCQCLNQTVVHQVEWNNVTYVNELDNIVFFWIGNLLAVYSAYIHYVFH